MISDINIPEWIKGLKTGFLTFLENVRNPGPYGRFRYAPHGCFLLHEPISSCYAFGILNRIKAYGSIEKGKKKEWIEYLLSFQDKKSGDFLSEEINKLCKKPEKNSLDQKYLMKRMLTRNITVTLKKMGYSSHYIAHYPETDTFTDKDKLIAHLDSFSIDKNPWGAGSHCGTTAGMLFERVKRGEEDFRQPLKWTIEYLLEKQDPETGLWGDHTCQLHVRINGAYKVAQKLITTFGILPNYPERLIDSVYNNYEDPSYKIDGCNEFDNVFVLAAALRATDYRKQEVEKLVLSRFSLIKPFKKQDGGFSYFKDECITTNADVPLVDRQRFQSDMAGTATFTAFFQSAFTILNWYNKLGWMSLWEDTPKKAFEL